MMVKLVGEYSVIGRSCLLHAGEDDLGTGGFSDSKTTGHAGARIACGIIGLANPQSFENILLSIRLVIYCALIE